MVERLAALAVELDGEGSYLGSQSVRKEREELAQLPGQQPVTSAMIRRFVSAAEGELRIGEFHRALEILERAVALADRVPGRERVANIAILNYYLGLTHLRIGETQNCVAMHTSDSCILPIGPAGVHTDQTGSRNAIEHFKRVLEKVGAGSNEQMANRWLLNIAFMTIGEYPDGVPQEHLIRPSRFRSDEEFPRFVDIAPELGLNSLNLSGGAILDDFDGDGLLDVFSSTWDPEGSLHFFKNLGNGSFQDRTKSAGLEGLFGGLNLSHADYDNDGDVDVFVPRGAWLGYAGEHPNSLLRNNGDGTFTDVSYDSGIAGADYPTQTAEWADYDLDGDLDLYIGNEAKAGNIYPCQLFRNDGDGTFTDVAEAAGVKNMRYAKGVSWGDYDGDRDPDLYVSNLAGDNRLYRNNGDGTFEDVAASAKVLEPLDSFPTWFWDYDNDGDLDLYCASYFERDTWLRIARVAAGYLGQPTDAVPACLYRGDGKGGFEDVARESGLWRVTMAMGANFGDIDNDGYLDFYLGTGYPFYDGLMPNLMYRNKSGKGFADITTAGGFGHLQKGHGISFGDVDNDGDQDVFEQMGGAFPGDAFGNVLYENPGFGRHWIKVELHGVESNRSGVGARVRVEIQDGESTRSVYRTVNTGGSFGCNPLTQHIGVSAAQEILSLEVYWPKTDRTQRFEKLGVDMHIRVKEDSDTFEVVPEKTFALR